MKPPEKPDDRDLAVYEAAYLLAMLGIVLAVLATIGLLVGVPWLWRLFAPLMERFS